MEQEEFQPLEEHPKILPQKTPLKIHQLNHNDQRLIVKEIILENFKSYQGRQVIGPFHKRFTSVVGPNGSGKSNLIESLLFVFGKKASWMRLKTLSQLIHNSSQHQDIKKASVEVIFHEIKDKEGEDYEIIENTEFSVRRTVNKQSVSKYEINNRESTQQEVIEMLKSKGIDLNNNRFLILQGEVEQISLMKPKSGDPEKPGLLEYLEDIIGSDQFKEEIEKKEEQHEGLQNERREKGERMRIHEVDLEKLNESKNLAVDYVRSERQKYQIINILGQIECYRNKRELGKLENKKKENVQKNLVTKQEIKQKIKENEDIIQEYKKNKQDIQNKEVEVNKYTGEFQKLNNKDAQIRQKLLLETENQTKIEKQIEDLQKEYNKIVRESKEYEKEIPGKKVELKQMEEKLDEEEKKLTELRNKINNENIKLVKEKKEFEKMLLPLKDEQIDIKQKKENLENKLKLITSDQNSIQNELSKCNLNNVKINESFQELKQTIDKANIVIQSINGKKNEELNTLQELKNYEQKIIRSMEECKQKIDQFNQQNQENTSRNKVLTELIHAQKQGKLNGILGRLGDLGTIHEQYDIAITTACPQLDNIIVERYEDAQIAVQFLRNEKIGKASFIALDKIEYNRNEMERQFQAPQGSLRLFDLINVKESRLRVAFYFAIRNTLLCEDIEMATQIGYGRQRHRVVTKKGELIESSGVMSGGGNPRKGGMSNKLKIQISNEELIRFQEEYNQNQNDLKQLRERMGQSQSDIQRLENDLKFVEKEIENKKFDLKLCEEQLEAGKKKVATLQKQVKPIQNNQKEVDKIQHDIMVYEQQYNNISKVVQEKQLAIQEVDDKINQIGGNELKKQQQLYNELKQKQSNYENSIFQMEAKLNDTEKNLNNNSKEKKNCQHQLIKIQDLIQKYQDQKQDIENQAVEIINLREISEKELETLKQKYEEKTQAKIKIQQILEEFQNNLEKIQKEIDETEIKIQKVQEELTKSNNQIQQNRTRYFEIISQYNFLDYLDEIANYQVGQEDQQQQRRPEISILEQTIIMENKNQMEVENDEENIQEKKIVHKQRYNIQSIMNIEVNQDLQQENIESIEKYKEELKIQKANTEEKLKSLGNEANINTINEFKEKYVEFKSRKEEFEKVKQKITELKQDVDKLKKERFEKFMSGFNLISSKLKETYQTLTNGGDAELELIDSLDPFSDGVNFTVRPPKKSWKQISKLSGGEKTLSSLSLVFALHYYKPTPLYFMDEIDAALDFKNVSIVGNYIYDRTKNAQFIIISLRNNMFELANKLVGVYKTNDATKTICIIPSLILQKIQEINQDKNNQNDE
ncbi:SMC4 structural maintenance of chromosomes 4, putative [Ichthyophthirius multifiliis]|uniref:Structural maintenance of chromosomes protein n=1 Tax=Ichthyophthirius multifiliis TaxID=5932 RepID=G0QK85_ICHMU|nr:SMC4 structural maintenance of chromosomes 4, putative [Ichthyophthirius multifiliis]EGR34361.1 SMC4 structural maintenance of chromosomes 4, putative [Ichthyophthirius multifiliis]|eukprot:XP_004039665.1 SMC4 structural maintenance of chromosomes 4, putative [Ichthyophthirius multifiliis]